ncbi:acyl-CoA dehydrogenase family protein [Actinomadura sp. BRA 177]|uniref:acyl-CoA dehydrogenase family protein n=1 Tax=Actinomadura sp. BRA 177 TaxID=2745202 RepID=UPI001C3C8458|nr:acyl-CoA dehydrogenase family protein [Actinomadura sp. BRA 177]
MDVPFTASGRALLDRLAAYEPRIRAEAERNDRAGVLSAEVFKGFAEDGIMGATVPAELGGLGVSRLHDVAVALKRLAESDPSAALALHVQFSRGLTLTYEWRYGAPHARILAERLLRSMATGVAVVCGAVKDAPGVVTELAPDGAGGWLLSGRKTLVSLAPLGTHFFVHAQRRVDVGPTRFVVPLVRRDTPGFAVLDDSGGLGMRASGTVDIVFDRCPVPADEILVRAPEPAGGRNDAVLAGHTVSSITMLGIYAGAAQAARDLAVGTAARRSADPPAAVRTLIADIDARLYSLKASAVAALVNADVHNDDLGADPAERGRAMMTPFQCAKQMVNRLAAEVVDGCLTVVGGAAYAGGHPLGRLYRDVRAGWFMQPYTYVDGVEYLSGQALGIDRDNDYVSLRAARDQVHY